jgi:hypothetical protein
MYGFFESALEWLIHNRKTEALLQIMHEESRVFLKMMLPHEALFYEPSGQLSAEIRGAGGVLIKKDMEDLAGLWLSFPLGGDVNE